MPWKGAACLVMPGWAESSQAPTHGGFVVFGVCHLVCQRVGGFMGPSPSVLLCRYCIFSVPEKCAEDTGEKALVCWGQPRLMWNHEAADEHWIGRRAERYHLYLCLSYDCSHWYSTGGWVLISFCLFAYFSDCSRLSLLNFWSCLFRN